MLPEGRTERILAGVLFAGLAALFAAAFLGGTSSVGAVRFWNNDDANILTTNGHLYKRLVLPPVTYISYPFLYYYAAALGVLPMFLWLGPVPKAIMLGWRLTNDLSFLATNLLLLAAGKRYFGSSRAGLIAAALHALCPVVLQQPFLVKPTAFQSLLNLLLLASLFELSRRPGRRWLVVSAVLAGLGFSAKYHAPFFFPTLYGLLLAVSRPSDLSPGERRLETRRGMAWAAGFLLAAGGLWGAVQYLGARSADWMARHPDWIVVKAGLAEHALLRFDLMATVALLVMGGVFLVSAWGFLRAREARGGSPFFTDLLIRVSLANAGAMRFFAVFLAVAAVTNPYVFVFPTETLNAFTVLFTIVETGGKMKDVLIGGPAARWFGIAAEPFVLGSVGIVLLAFALLFELFAGRRGGDAKARFPFRMILWAYGATYFLYLYTQIGYRKHHYLEPLIPVAALLSGAALATLVDRIRNGGIRRLAWAAGLFVLGLSVMERGPALNQVRHWVTGRDRDPGVRAAEWINRNYPGRPTVLSDLLPITYLLKGQVVAGGFHYRPWQLREILGRIAPPDLIILNRRESLKLAPSFRGRYHLVRSDFSPSRQGDIEMILIYERLR